MTTTSSTSLQETLETSSIDITHPPLDQSGLENVANFRDVGRNYNVDADGREESTALREGNLYRSARLDDATSEDVKVLQSRYNIKTVIDLRSDLERKECDHVASTFLFSAIEEEVQEELSPMHTHKSSCFQTQVLPEEFRNGKRTRYSIEFAGEDFRKYSVWKPLGVLTKLKVIALIVFRQKPRAVQMVGEEVIAPKGLRGLYRDFVDYCGNEIVQALKLMSVPENYPVLVHCTQGKDRTGIVIALALSCANIPLEQILLDFSRSQKGLASQRDTMVKEMAKAGLDPSFSDAPENVMRDTFGYIVDKYGSVEEYLETKGFTKVWRERLKACLTASDEGRQE